jgi:GDP-L-fucose synthase
LLGLQVRLGRLVASVLIVPDLGRTASRLPTDVAHSLEEPKITSMNPRESALDLASHSILVTGGAGFVGRSVVKLLRDRGATDFTVPRSCDYDLRDEAQAARLFEEVQPEIVIDLAAVVGGIGINSREPVRFFRDNLRMGTNLVEQAQRHKVKKFVGVGTVCSYPKNTRVPFRESDLWSGFPEETNAPYGLAKKMVLVHLNACRLESGFNGIYLLPVNLYGPGDNFSPDSSHVIPALIRKICAAHTQGDDEVEVWGDGSATREFLHVEDAAEGIVRAAECYNGGIPINLGSGMEITIADLAALIRELIGYQGRLVWNTSRPNGQPRRCVDSSRAREHLGFQAKRELRNGLCEVIAWWKDQVDAH